MSLKWIVNGWTTLPIYYPHDRIGTQTFILQIGTHFPILRFPWIILCTDKTKRVSLHYTPIVPVQKPKTVVKPNNISTTVPHWNECTFLQQKETKIQDKRGVRILMFKKRIQTYFAIFFHHSTYRYFVVTFISSIILNLSIFSSYKNFSNY